jgi:hypothetical protein
MTSFKDILVKFSKDKYGETQRGIFSNENISKDEMIRYCECGSNDGKYTRDQLLEIIDKNPKLEYFVRSFSYMVDDDIYHLASKYNDEQVNDLCSYFNHSCDPNCGFDSSGHGYYAIKNINQNDEIVFHYGMLETEASLIYGLDCKCGSINCDGKLFFENYRNNDFIDKYYDYFTPYLKNRVNDLKSKWFSSSCYLKRIPVNESKNINDWKKCLFSLKTIKKNEHVSSFSASESKPREENHYLRHSTEANCFIQNNQVFAIKDIEIESELTLNFLSSSSNAFNGLF